MTESSKAVSIYDVIKYIKKAGKLLPPDNPNKEYFANVPGYAETALSLIDSKDALASEKTAFLWDAITRWATQLTFILWRFEVLTPEIEEEFRSFMPVEKTTEDARKYEEERTAKGKDLEASRDALIEEDNQMDLFKAVIGGMNPDEAKRKLDEYNEKLAQSQK